MALGNKEKKGHTAIKKNSDQRIHYQYSQIHHILRNLKTNHEGDGNISYIIC